MFDRVRLTVRFTAAGVLLGAAAMLVGCVSLTAPERITIGGADSEPVDSRSTPQISTVEEGRAELDKAYRALRRLESENAELARDIDKLKRERNQYKRERDDSRKALEDSRED
ncbi:MAG: hypothetical protein IT450_16175 [Phycisphaerales bacterium]|nr:hypothetical protein [Phycisphaerales bacterium]